MQLLYFSTLQKLLLKYRAWQLQVAIFAFGEMVCDFPHEDSQSDFKSPLDKTIFCNDKNWTVRYLVPLQKDCAVGEGVTP